MSARAPASITVLLALVGLCACGPDINVSDDIDEEWDREPTHSYNNVVHSPYVVGASLELYAYDASEGYALDGWTLASSDPAVLRIDTVSVERDQLNDDDKRNAETDIITAEVTAVGPGEAFVEVRKPNGKIVHEVEVRVRQPDEVVLRAAGPLFIEENELAPDLVDATPKLLADGFATFMVEWWAEGERLHGTGALSLATDYPETTRLFAATEHLDERREWARLQLGASGGPASASVEFLANGEPAASVGFDIVDASAIETIELIAQDTLGAEFREVLAVLARALDLDGETIWGVAFDWDLNGLVEPDEGDIFRYWFEPGRASRLGVQYGEIRADIDIVGDQGFVASSNDDLDEFGSCFCSVPVEGDAPRGITFGLLSLLALAGLRRRR